MAVVLPEKGRQCALLPFYIYFSSLKPWKTYGRVREYANYLSPRGRPRFGHMLRATYPRGCLAALPSHYSLRVWFYKEVNLVSVPQHSANPTRLSP